MSNGQNGSNGNGAAPAEKPDAKQLAVQQAGNMGAVLSSGTLRKQLATILPTHLDPDRFVRIAILASSRTPALKQCTQESLMSCLIDLTQLGLEPDGRRAHLIPYGNVCTLVIDYKGLMDLARRSGEVLDIQCDVVYEKEFESGRFDFERGSNARLVHKPILVGDRGEIIGAYSFVKMKNGEEGMHWMRTDEIEAIRKRSKAGANPKAPWATDWKEMAKKTVFRQHSKMLPFSSQLQEKIETDDHHLFDFNMQAGQENGNGEPPTGRQRIRPASVTIESQTVAEPEEDPTSNESSEPDEATKAALFAEEAAQAQRN